MLKLVYTTLSLAPSPLFFIMGIYSALTGPAICGSFLYEMTLMWFLMSLAHVTPWLLWFQQRNFTRN